MAWTAVAAPESVGCGWNLDPQVQRTGLAGGLACDARKTEDGPGWPHAFGLNIWQGEAAVSRDRATCTS